MEAWIESVDEFGLMKVEFKQEFIIQNFSEVDSSVLNITIVHYDESDN